VGLLEGPGPRIDVAVVVVLAVPAERPGLCPGLHDEVVSFEETPVRLGRVEALGVVLRADPANEAADDSAPARDVEEGYLLGEVQRVGLQRERVTEHRDLRVGMRGLVRWINMPAIRFGEGIKP